MVALRENTPAEKNKYQQKRAPYEFDKLTIVQGLMECGYTCERCQTKKRDTLEGYLEAHHRLPIHVVLEEFPHLSAVHIKSLANLEILCVTCHKDEHQNEDMEKYREYGKYFEESQERAEKARKMLGSSQRRRV